jgi:hypothetical protein
MKFRKNMWRFSITLLLTSLLSLISGEERADAEEKVECTFQVKKGWPTYRLVLLNNVENKSYQNSIYLQDNTKLQDLPEPPEEPEEKVELDTEDENYLRVLQEYYQRPNCGFVDINFDGYLDVRGHGHCGSACMVYYWLFNPKNKKFEYSFGSNNNPEPLPKEKIVYSVGYSGGTFYIDKSRWKNGKLYSFYSEELKLKPDELSEEFGGSENEKDRKETYIKYVKIRKNGKWVKLPPKKVQLSQRELPRSNGW